MEGPELTQFFNEERSGFPGLGAQKLCELTKICSPGCPHWPRSMGMGSLNSMGWPPSFEELSQTLKGSTGDVPPLDSRYIPDGDSEDAFDGESTSSSTGSMTPMNTAELEGSHDVPFDGKGKGKEKAEPFDNEHRFGYGGPISPDDPYRMWSRLEGHRPWVPGALPDSLGSHGLPDYMPPTGLSGSSGGLGKSRLERMFDAMDESMYHGRSTAEGKTSRLERTFDAMDKAKYLGRSTTEFTGQSAPGCGHHKETDARGSEPPRSNMDDVETKTVEDPDQEAEPPKDKGKGKAKAEPFDEGGRYRFGFGGLGNPSLGFSSMIPGMGSFPSMIGRGDGPMSDLYSRMARDEGFSGAGEDWSSIHPSYRDLCKNMDACFPGCPHMKKPTTLPRDPGPSNQGSGLPGAGPSTMSAGMGSPYSRPGGSFPIPEMFNRMGRNEPLPPPKYDYSKIRPFLRDYCKRIGGCFPGCPHMCSTTVPSDPGPSNWKPESSGVTDDPGPCAMPAGMGYRGLGEGFPVPGMFDRMGRSGSEPPPLSNDDWSEIRPSIRDFCKKYDVCRPGCPHWTPESSSKVSGGVSATESPFPSLGQMFQPPSLERLGAETDDRLFEIGLKRIFAADFTPPSSLGQASNQTAGSKPSTSSQGGGVTSIPAGPQAVPDGEPEKVKLDNVKKYMDEVAKLLQDNQSSKAEEGQSAAVERTHEEGSSEPGRVNHFEESEDERAKKRVKVM